MEYKRLLGNFVSDPITDDEVIDVTSTHQILEPEFIRPRLGIPTGFISWEENQIDLQKVIWRTIKSGYNNSIPKNINPKLRTHLEYFRNHLDIYDILIKDKVFSKEELWLRSLQEGPSFTDFIKKSRKGSLQQMISIEDNNIKDEYKHPEYSGYDSILHEAYLPYWDDSASTEDYIYSFIEEGENKQIDKLLVKMYEDYAIVKEHKSILFLQPVAGKKSLSDEVNKTTLLKNVWHLNDGPGGRYYGKRVVVPTFPGSTRDTAVPDVYTLGALKILGRAARVISEQLPYSANCSYETLNSRVRRMKRNKIYLHIDFKKFGLTAPRQAINAVIRSYDTPDLQIDTFYLEVDGDVLQTNRGTALGWLDSTTAIAIMSILHNLRKKEGWADMDFIVFNDDVEIGFKIDDETELMYRKERILEELEAYGFILSHRKIFYSRMMIFLENYSLRGQVPQAMRKLQLVTKLYAKSLSTPFKWKAKVLHAEAALKVKNIQIREICINSIQERKPEEMYLPVELGGWEYHLDKELIGSRPLNLALEEASVSEISYFLKMRKYKEPHLCPKKEIVNLEVLYKRLNRNMSESYKPDPKQFKERIMYDPSERLGSDEMEAIQITRPRVENEATGIPDLDNRLGKEPGVT